MADRPVLLLHSQAIQNASGVRFLNVVSRQIEELPGTKLQCGATGLGQTPRDAWEDFNMFIEPLLSRTASEKE